MGNTKDDALEKFRMWLKVRGKSDGTIKSYTWWIQHFLQYTENSIQEIKQSNIDDFVCHIMDNHSDNSVRIATIALKTFLIKYLELPLKVHILNKTTIYRDKTPFTIEEVKKMFAVTKDNPLYHVILKVLYYSALRRQEVINLDLDDVLPSLQLRVKCGKGKEYKVVNITRDCMAAIQRYIQVRLKPHKRHEKALFITNSRQRITRGGIYHIVKTASAMAGIDRPAYPHKFRITAITHMAEAGLDISEIQAQTHHQEIKSLVGYIQHSQRRIREQYEKAFENNGIEVKPPQLQMDREYYKQMAIKKYLDKEIDLATLHDMLTTIEQKKDKKQRKEFNIAYY